MKEESLKILCYSIISTIWHSEKGNTIETVESQVVVRGWGKGGRDEAQMIHRAVKLFHNTIMVETWQYGFVKSQRNKEWTYKLGMSTKSLQSCLTLCEPLDYSLPGSSVHGILQARILEWVAIPSSRGCNQPRDWTSISYISSIGR